MARPMEHRAPSKPKKGVLARIRGWASRIRRNSKPEDKTAESKPRTIRGSGRVRD